MLTSLLPGLREIRAPLISGYLWLTLFFLAFHNDIPNASHPGGALEPIFEIGDSLSALGVATVSGVAAYLVGSAVQQLLKVVAQLLPLSKPVYAEPGTHFSETGREDIIGFIEIKVEAVRRKLFQVALSPGERGVDEEPGAWRIERELPLIRTLLLGERPELVGEVDRLQAEADLRITVAVPLAFLAVYLAITASPGWLVGAGAAVLLFAQGYQRQIEAGDLMAKALRIGKANAPALESLEASADAALERTELEEELGKKADGDGNALAAFRLGNLRASGEDFEGALTSLQFAAANGVVRAHVEIGLVYERIDKATDAERAFRDGANRGDKKASERLTALLESQRREEEALETARQTPTADDGLAEEEVARTVPGERARIAQYRRGVEGGSGKAAINLGLLMERRGDIEAAIDAFKRATELEAADPQAWIHLGRVERKRGWFGDAETAVRRALVLQEQQLGPEHLEVAQTLNGLGLIYKNWGRYEDARVALDRAKAIQIELVGADHLATAPTLDNLGNVLAGLGRYEEAEELQERALAIEERQLGPDDKQTAITLVNLGCTVSALGEHRHALELQERGLEIFEDAPEADPPVVAMVRAELATTLCALKEFDRARELQTQALEQARESFGPKHPKVAELLSGLGEILFRLELLADSEAVLREGIAIAQETPDPNLPELSYLLRRLAQVECARDRAVDAKVTVEQAVEMQRTALGDHHIELAKTLELQARIVEDLGEPEAAAAAREQAREIRGQAGLREAGID